ncbi:MAG: hypothetical protein AB7I38_03730 [Dehalococcoidia bacterium]
MDEHTKREVAIRPVDDSDACDRERRLTELLATGIDRWLRAQAVDSDGDVSVYPDVGPTPW